MRNPSRRWRTHIALLTTLLGIGTAHASPSAADKRRELLNKIDLQPKQETKPPETSVPEDAPDDLPADSPAPETPAEGPETPTAPGSDSAQTKSSTPRVTYTGRVHALLQSGCAGCHKPGGPAGGTKFVLTGDAAKDYTTTRAFTRGGDPPSSPLLTKAAGQAHGGGSPFPVGSSKHETVLAWIVAGTPRGGGAAAAAPPAAGETAGAATAAATTGAVAGAAATQAAAPASSTPAPTASSSIPAGTPSPSGPASASDAVAVPTNASTPEATAGVPFAPQVHGILVEKCATCHVAGGMAGTGRFVLTRDPALDLDRTIALIDLGDPTASPLLTKASGQSHGGGTPLPVDSQGYALVLEWAKSHIPAADKGADVTIDAMSGASPQLESRLGDGTALPTPPAASTPIIPFSLPFHLRLNGRFDFSYERRNYRGHPFQGQGQDAFQSYHHFLFLSRSGAKDPFGFNVELITQQFYEFNGRFSTKNKKVQFLLKAGKILVPFGDEPLMHTSYGGRTGFDQELLPVVWAVPGVSLNVQGRVGPVTIGNDIYVIQGHRLRAEDSVLNLQSDFSSLEDVNVGFGDRIGLSVLPLTVWYSFQLTPMEFDRLLFMQALDLEFWRLRHVPVLKDIVFALGGMRADVAGAGPGQDYYHFGSYLTLRYYPTVDFIYIQYRAGLKTFDNRRGLYFDDTRIDERDRGSHNLTVMVRYEGFYGGVQFFWNLEKANEQDDDFLRITLGYEF